MDYQNRKKLRPFNDPKHKRVKMSPLSSPDQPLRVRILGPTEVFVTEDCKYVQLNLFDGVMQFNRRYSSVIEKLKEGEIKLKLFSTSEKVTLEKRYYISSGWLILAHNLCEILVKSCREI